MNVLAVDIGGTHYRVALVNQTGTILSVQRAPVRREAGAAELLQRLLPQILAVSGQAVEPVQAVGIGFGGPVDFRQQRVMRSLHVAGWDGFSFRDWLRPHLDVPLVVDNDGNVGALGEYRFGAGRGSTDMVYYTVSTGVGGGIVLDGQIRRGMHSQAGELGHVPLLPSGPLCTCGARGCLEALCSGPALARQALDLIEGGSCTSILTLRFQEQKTLTARDVFACAHEGDPRAVELLQRARHWFSSAVRAVVRTIDPDTVVVGGGVGTAPGFLDGLEAAVNEHPLLADVPKIAVKAAALGDDSVLLGAAAMALALHPPLGAQS